MDRLKGRGLTVDLKPFQPTHYLEDEVRSRSAGRKTPPTLSGLSPIPPLSGRRSASTRHGPSAHSNAGSYVAFNPGPVLQSTHPSTHPYALLLPPARVETSIVEDSPGVLLLDFPPLSKDAEPRLGRPPDSQHSSHSPSNPPIHPIRLPPAATRRGLDPRSIAVE